MESHVLDLLVAKGRTIERGMRSLRRYLSPAFALHQLRWKLHGRDRLEQRTEQRLQVDGHFWLFVLGLNNSGTTLVVDLLKSHPAIRCLPNEGQYLTGALPLPRSFGVPRNFARRLDVFHWTENSDPEPARRVKYDWSYYYESRPGILLEKSPPNSLRSRWLQMHFRPSRFVAIVRHPYAVCEGIRRREGTTIEEAALHWVVAHECMLDDFTHLHNYILMRYEDLCQHPEENLEKLENFLDLDCPVDRTSLTTPKTIHNIDGVPQLICNFNDRSVARLSNTDLACINRIAGPLMERLGYTTSTIDVQPFAQIQRITS